MSDRSKEEFWRELMGEDYESLTGEPEVNDEEEAPPIGQGFTIERVDSEGRVTDTSRIDAFFDQDARHERSAGRAPRQPMEPRYEEPPERRYDGRYHDEELEPYPINGRGPYPDEVQEPYPDEGDGQYPDEGEEQYPDEAQEQYPDEGEEQYPYEEYPDDERDLYPEEVPEPYPEEAPAEREPEPARTRREKRRKKDDDDFEIDFDFDAEYEDVDEKAVRRGRTKKTGCLGGILFCLFVISISVILACFGWMAAVDVLGLGDDEGLIEITIPKEIISKKTVTDKEDGVTVTKTVDSADIDVVAKMLCDKGLIKYEWLFKIFSRFAHADTKIRPGTYQLNLNFDYRALVNGMTASGGRKVEIDVTIPEGYTITDIVRVLTENKVCDKDELMDALANHIFEYEFLSGRRIGDPKRLEGFLFPDTYTFYVNDTPVRVINKFLSNFNRKWTEEMSAQAEELGYSMYDVLIVASMIEKEAGADSERARIASVIYNRLKNPEAQETNGLLQIDATIRYVIQDTGEDFSTSVDSPYNTYLHQGLTPGPIANPGLKSIEAALSPENTKYYFYALGKDGVHKFFKTYKDFQKFVNSDEYAYYSAE